MPSLPAALERLLRDRFAVPALRNVRKRPGCDPSRWTLGTLIGRIREGVDRETGPTARQFDLVITAAGIDRTSLAALLSYQGVSDARLQWLLSQQDLPKYWWIQLKSSLCPVEIQLIHIRRSRGLYTRLNHKTTASAEHELAGLLWSRSKLPNKPRICLHKRSPHYQDRTCPPSYTGMRGRWS